LSRKERTSASRFAAHSRPTRWAIVLKWFGLIETDASSFRSSLASLKETALPA
jgi:hypothetical protein